MKLKDFNLLRKLMKMTESDNEGERNNAISQASALMRRSGVTWDRFFDRAVKIEIESVPVGEGDGGREELRERIEQALVNVEESDPRGGFADFVASLREQWDEKHWMSRSQQEALFQAEARCAQGGYRR